MTTDDMTAAAEALLRRVQAQELGMGDYAPETVARWGWTGRWATLGTTEDVTTWFLYDLSDDGTTFYGWCADSPVGVITAESLGDVLADWEER